MTTPTSPCCAAGWHCRSAMLKTPVVTSESRISADPDDHETVFGLVCALELAGESGLPGHFVSWLDSSSCLGTLVDRAATASAP